MALGKPFISATYSFQHQFIQGVKTFVYTAEDAHYLHIMLGEDSESLTYNIDENSFVLEKGFNSIHYIPAAAAIDLKSICALNKFVVLRISPENLVDFHQKYQADKKKMTKGFISKSDQRLRLLFEQMCSQPMDENFYQQKRELLLLEMVLRQAETFVLADDDHQDLALKSHYDKMRLAKEIIESDLSKSYSIPELAKQVGTNVQYLKKYFKQYFGKTVMSYITEKKMDYAKDLILTGQHRIADVAHMTGYKHATHFTTAFKKHFGFIPNSLKYTFLIQQGVTVLHEMENIVQQVL